MLKKIEERDLPRLLEMLAKDLDNCIYMYIDLKEYGIENENVLCWLEESNEGIVAAMKYFDSFQLYTNNDNWDVEAVVCLLQNNEVKSIHGPTWMISKLEQRFAAKYDAAYGLILKHDSYRNFKQFSLVKKASIEDMPEVAHLMCSDEEFGKTYKEDILCQQLINRTESGVGENYIIVEDGEIVAHNAIFAQTAEVAVVSGLIANEKGRKKLYGFIMNEYVKKIALDRNQLVYSFRIKENLVENANVVKENICSEYGKMTRKTDE